MIREIANILPYIIAGMIGLAALLFIVSVQQLRRGRKGAYWRLRRDAGQRGGQLFLISITLFGIAVALALFSGLADLAFQRLRAALNNDPNTVYGVALLDAAGSTVTAHSTATATMTATSSPSASTTAVPRTATPVPTAAPSASSTPTPTETAIPSATPTLTPTFEYVLALTPAVSAVQAQTGASIQITAAALEVNSDGSPVNPGDQFPAGEKRIYLFTHYQNMTAGTAWSRILYRDGVAIQGQSYLWSLEASGNSIFFFGDSNGYPAGNYAVKLFVGSQEVGHFAFSLSGST